MGAVADSLLISYLSWNLIFQITRPWKTRGHFAAQNRGDKYRINPVGFIPEFANTCPPVYHRLARSESMRIGSLKDPATSFFVEKRKAGSCSGLAKQGKLNSRSQVRATPCSWLTAVRRPCVCVLAFKIRRSRILLRPKGPNDFTK